MEVISSDQGEQVAMNIQKPKHNRTLMTVLQGLLLLVILSSLLSVCISLLVTGFNADVQALNKKVTENQAVISEENGQMAAEGLAALNEATAELEQYRDRAGSLKLLAIIMYAAFALLFLLRALITGDSWHLNRFRYGICSLLFAACAGLFVFTDSTELYILIVVLNAIALIADHVFAMIENHKIRNAIPRILSILLLLLIVACAILLGGSFALLYLLFLTIPRIFYYIAEIAFSRIKMDVLRKIVRKTYAAEILFGMLLLMIAFSIILPQFDIGIPSFADALWYCFAIVTTIGFGDFAAATLPGRIISVVLGLYGIIVVALVTSIIVNFYNETKNTADPDDTEEKTRDICAFSVSDEISKFHQLALDGIITEEEFQKQKQKLLSLDD